MTTPSKSPGQIAYEAYSADLPLISWDSVPIRTQTAWMRVARAVVEHHEEQTAKEPRE